MRYLLCVILFSTLLFTGCKKADEKSESAAEAAQPSTSTDAKQLSEEQKAEGWKLLFDGQSMTGWRTYRGLENNSWEV
ncbi:MAG TPA: hypothetical protein VFW11_06600, partial [Cyclobacteriaceae bacterium]|nr:hypothetical protein [Cyclobacteriaceae bacterium]